MIGSTKKVSDLYLLEVEQTIADSISLALVNLNKRDYNHISNKSEIMLWHYRLCHPNFMYLEKLFLALFNKIKPNDLQCEVCYLSKHDRSSFPTQPYKSSYPFSIIHSDIWGPNITKNIIRARWFITSLMITHKSLGRSL